MKCKKVVHQTIKKMKSNKVVHQTIRKMKSNKVVHQTIRKMKSNKVVNPTIKKIESNKENEMKGNTKKKSLIKENDPGNSDSGNSHTLHNECSTSQLLNTQLKLYQHVSVQLPSIKENEMKGNNKKKSLIKENDPGNSDSGNSHTLQNECSTSQLLNTQLKLYQHVSVQLPSIKENEMKGNNKKKSLIKENDPGNSDSGNSHTLQNECSTSKVHPTIKKMKINKVVHQTIKKMKSNKVVHQTIKKIESNKENEMKGNTKKKSLIKENETRNSHTLQNECSTSIVHQTIKKMKSNKVVHPTINKIESNKENEMKGNTKKKSLIKENEPGNSHTLQNECSTSQLLNTQLKIYQHVGVRWLWCSYSHGLEGAILADEMGLGKTVQIIAFICKIIESQVLQPILIVCPLSVLNNWDLEFQKFAPQLKVIKYYGHKSERKAIRKQFQVEALSEITLSKILCPSSRKKTFTLKLPRIVLTTPQIVDKDHCFLRNIKWNIVVVDEGHSVKNNKSKLNRTLSSFSAVFKALLTGTPLQNNIKELWALLEFVQPSNTFDYKIFEKILDDQLSLTENTEAVDSTSSEILEKLHDVLKPFFLRRLKADVNLNLPPKKTTIIYCPMVSEQKELYSDVLKKSIKMAKKDKVESCMDDITRGRKRKRSSTVSEEVSADSEEVSADSVEVSTDSDPVQDQIVRSFKRKCTLNVSYEHLEDESDNNDDEDEFWFDFPVYSESSFVSQTPINPDEILYDNNLKLVNVHMCLRNIIGHPYLVMQPYKIVNGQKHKFFDETLITSSGKMIVLNQLLFKLKETNHKTLVFSTMTRVLDIIEEMCILKDYAYHRLDGSIANVDRTEMVDQFNNGNEWSVFLISTRAGGQGLNLTGADTCIMYDSDYNPQIDIQAEARCHRIGQTKPVCIYRLITKDTLDEIIYNTAHFKRRLEKMVLPEHLFKYHSGKLLDLMKNRNKETCQHPNGEIYTDEEIEKFLDRSDLLTDMLQQDEL